jgi:hypothetical protein
MLGRKDDGASGDALGSANRCVDRGRGKVMMHDVGSAGRTACVDRDGHALRCRLLLRGCWEHRGWQMLVQPVLPTSWAAASVEVCCTGDVYRSAVESERKSSQ